VSRLEALLRLSVIQAEMMEIAKVLGPKAARVVRYSATVLGLLRGARAHEGA
jgi:hypothetical protein